MLARLTFPLSVAFAAAFTAQVEGMLVTRWAADRGSACSATSPTGACTLNGTISFLAGTFFAVETLAATLTALVDRKSTRLNSSHSQISYAVFCLKKKTRVAYSLLRQPSQAASQAAAALRCTKAAHALNTTLYPVHIS